MGRRLKFKKQRDGFRCGPIAIHNALVALGMETPVFKKIIRACRCTKPNGTPVKNMPRAAKKFGLKLKRVDPERLHHKGTHIVRIQIRMVDTDEWFGHYVVVHEGKVHNLAMGKGPMSYNWILRGTLLYRLRGYGPVVWKVLKDG